MRTEHISTGGTPLCLLEVKVHNIFCRMIITIGSPRKLFTELYKSHNNVNKDITLNFTEELVNIL